MITDNILNQKLFSDAYSYESYMELMEDLSENGRTSGPTQSEALANYTALNWQRIKRVDKTVKIDQKLTIKLSKLKVNWIWLVIVEAWCGDVPSNLPVINKMASLIEGVEVKLILRDSHLEVIDAFLTNGGRAIPKLVCVEKESFKVIGTWGPRPLPAQEMVMEYKSMPESERPNYDEFVKGVQLWYAKDRGKTIQAEFEDLINTWNDKIE